MTARAPLFKSLSLNSEQEEAALLTQAPTHIQVLIGAAIDTGMRFGEMLALRFADIDLNRG